MATHNEACLSVGVVFHFIYLGELHVHVFDSIKIGWWDHRYYRLRYWDWKLICNAANVSVSHTKTR